MRNAFWVFLGTTFAGLLIFGVVRLPGAALPRPQRAGPPAAAMQVTIPRGATAQDVAALLNDAGLIKNPMLFRLYAVQRGAASRIRPGTLPGARRPSPPRSWSTPWCAAWPTSWSPSPSPRARPSSRSPTCWTPPGITRKSRLHQHRGERRRSFATWSCPAPRWRGTCTPTPTGSARAARRRGGHLHGAPAQAGLRGADARNTAPGWTS